MENVTITMTYKQALSVHCAVASHPGIVAVDPDVIPLGSIVVIEGQRYLAADTGVTGNAVDICAASHEEAVEFGIQNAEVRVMTP